VGKISAYSYIGLVMWNDALFFVRVLFFIENIPHIAIVENDMWKVKRKIRRT